MLPSGYNNILPGAIHCNGPIAPALLTVEEAQHDLQGMELLEVNEFINKGPLRGDATAIFKTSWLCPSRTFVSSGPALVQKTLRYTGQSMPVSMCSAATTLPG